MNQAPPIIQFNEDKHTYTVDGDPYPSVTQILDKVTPKDALPWWGMRVGIGAVVQMLQTGKISWPSLSAQVYDEILTGVPVEGPKKKNRRGVDKVEIEALVIENKLSTNHVRDKAADRGTEIHEAINIAGVEQRLPDITTFTEEMRPYIQAFSRWWLDQDPELLEMELLVCDRDVTRRFAGRLDLIGAISDQRCLIDFKTSKAIYESHKEQVKMYELGYLHCGGEPVDRLVVVQLGPDGQYSMEDSYVSEDTVVHACGLYYAREADKARSQKPLTDQRNR
jgi:hypothetical protein